MQGNRLVAQIDAGVRIGCESCSKSFCETRFELPDCFEAGAELPMQREPRNIRRLSKIMEPPRQPDVNVERHGAVP